MDLHADAEAFRQFRLANAAPEFHTMTPDQARQAQRAARIAANVAPPMVGEVRDSSVAGPQGRIGLRLYRPDEGRTAGALPTLIYFHGGGWVTGDLESHDILCRNLVIASGCAIVAVNYRLAPEHRFPAAPDDARAAVAEIAAQAEDFGIDPARIGVGGDSAGGNLAAVCALAARDGTLPPLAFQFLLYPCTDLRMGYPSYDEGMPGLPVNGAAMEWFRGHYLATPEQAEDWRASPLLADLSGVAPAYVLTLGHDPVRDEGRAYAEALHGAGVAVREDHLADQIHGLLTMGAAMPSVAGHVEMLGRRLRDGLAGQ